MNKKIQRSLAVVSAAALVFGVASVSTAQAKSKAKTIYLAFQGPLSGASAQTGVDEINSVKYAVKLFNAKNKKKFNVKVVAVDDQGEAATAATVAPGTASNKAIIGLVGPAYSGATIASLPYYKATGLALVSPSATRVSITDPQSPDFGGPVFHRAVGKDDKQGPALAKYATAGVSKARVFIVDDQSAYAVPLADYVTAGLKGVKGASVVGTDSVPDNTTDFSPTIAKIQTSSANVVIYTGYYGQAAIFVKQLRDSGSKAIFAGGDGVLNQEFANLAGASGDGSRLTGVGGFEGVSAKMEAAFKKSMGVSSGVYAVESFDATNIFLEGIVKGNTTRAKMLKWVRTYNGKSVTGAVLKFDKYGDIPGGAFAGFTVKAGLLVNTGIVK